MTPQMALQNTTPVDNPSEEGDDEDGVRGDLPPPLLNGFDGGPEIEGGGFGVRDSGGVIGAGEYGWGGGGGTEDGRGEVGVVVGGWWVEEVSYFSE